MRNIIILIQGLLLVLSLIFTSTNVFSQVRNYKDWNILASDLTGGKLAFNADQKKKIHISVTVSRFLAKGSSTVYEDVDFIFKLGRVPKNATSALDISDEGRVTTANFTTQVPTLATVDLTLEMQASGTNTGDGFLADGDNIVINVKDPKYGWAIQDKEYSVTVTTLGNPKGAITNNLICCNQCILSGEAPEPITQAPGKILSGDISRWTIWSHGITTYKQSGYVAGNWQSYSPGPMDKSTNFFRLLNASKDVQGINDPETYSGDASNMVTISISSLKSALSVPPTIYQGNELIKAGVITIQGDQTINRSRSSSPDLQVNFVGARQIVISANTRISDNMHFSIDPGIVTCGTGARIAVSEVDTILPVVEKPSENISFLHAYPNPTDGDMTIKYSISKKGNVKLYVSDNFGRLTTTLVDSQTADPGKYEVVFNSRGLITGVYFCTLMTNGHKEVKKLIVTNQSQSK